LKDTILVRGATISDMEVSLLPEYITSPDETFRVCKTDPVTSLGFVPVPFARNWEEPREGRNVTVAGYGSNWSWNPADAEKDDFPYAYPGAAMKAQLQVMAHEYCDQALPDYMMDYATEFCAVAPQKNFRSTLRPLAPAWVRTPRFVLDDAATRVGGLNEPVALLLAGDEGAPVLDINGTLVGMVYTTGMLSVCAICFFCNLKVHSESNIAHVPASRVRQDGSPQCVFSHFPLL
jgi:hypothetical protein